MYYANDYGNDTAFHAHLWRTLRERPEDYDVDVFGDDLRDGSCTFMGIEDFIDVMDLADTPQARAVFDAIDTRSARIRREYARTPQARQDAQVHQRHVRQQQRQQRQQRQQQQMMRAELEDAAERITEGDEEAFQHWLEEVRPAGAPLDDEAFQRFLVSREPEWLEMSNAARLPHYEAVGARPPSLTRLPATYFGAQHRALCTAMRARRRMPRRGQRPDSHVEHEQRAGVLFWSAVTLYRSWLGGNLDADSAPTVNNMLSCALGPAGSGSLSFIDDEGQDLRVDIDIRSDSAAQRARLCDLGWSASYPTVPELVSHVLDRLEYDWALRLTESILRYGTSVQRHSQHGASEGVAFDADGNEQADFDLLDPDFAFFDPDDPEPENAFI